MMIGIVRCVISGLGVVRSVCIQIIAWCIVGVCGGVWGGGLERWVGGSDCRGVHVRNQSSSTTSSPYISSSFASVSALSSAIFCVRKALMSPCRVLSDDCRAARYATRSGVDGVGESAGSDEEKTCGEDEGTVGEV